MTEVTPSLENSRFQAFFKITVLRSPAREGSRFLWGKPRSKAARRPGAFAPQISGVSRELRRANSFRPSIIITRGARRHGCRWGRIAPLPLSRRRLMQRRLWRKNKRLSRREQRGWTGARNTNQENEFSVCVPSRREAARREQARRDSPNHEIPPRMPGRDFLWGKPRSKAVACGGEVWYA